MKTEYLIRGQMSICNLIPVWPPALLSFMVARPITSRSYDRCRVKRLRTRDISPGLKSRPQVICKEQHEGSG